MSTYLANEILDHVFKGDAYTQPTDLYIGLATASMSDSTTGSTVTEPSDTYARVNVNDWVAAALGALDNGSLIDFADASSGYGTVVDYFLADAASDGNIMLYAEFTASKAIGAGDDPQFAAGALDITLD